MLPCLIRLRWCNLSLVVVGSTHFLEGMEVSFGKILGPTPHIEILKKYLQKNLRQSCDSGLILLPFQPVSHLMEIPESALQK